MRRWLLPSLLLAEVITFTAISGPRFDSAGACVLYFQKYFGDLLAQSAPVLVLAFGMTLVLAGAGIDLSVGSLTALVACVMSSFNSGAFFWWTALPAGLGVALLLGVCNGLLIARLEVPPIIATLGTMILFRGLCFAGMGDLEKSPFLDAPGYEWFGQVPGASCVLAAVYLLGGFYVSHSRWWREVLTIGGNRVVARYAAIPVQRRLSEAYVLMGLLAFVAAVCFTARNGSVSASSLTGVELHVIVAVVLGGASVQGGRASLGGTFFGVLVIAVLEEGLRGATAWGDRHLPFKISHLEFLFLGVLLVFSVWMQNTVKTKLKAE